MDKSGKAMNITLWAVTGLLAGFFLLAGIVKLAGLLDPTFARWGYMYNTRTPQILGVLEIAGAVGLLYRRTTGWSALVLMVITVGWMRTHIVFDEYILLIAPIAVFVLLGFVIWGWGLPWQRRDEVPPRAATTHRGPKSVV